MSVKKVGNRGMKFKDLDEFGRKSPQVGQTDPFEFLTKRAGEGSWKRDVVELRVSEITYQCRQ